MDHVRFGVIGLGNMGSVHAREHVPSLEGATLGAVCDIVPSKMEPYDGVAKFADSRDLIRSGLVDAVILATPHYDHTTIGIDAFENGLHVMCEKPISAHKADAERLIAARRPGLAFGAMFQTRTSASMQRLRHLIQSGELGEIRRITWIATSWFRSAAYYASSAWRATWGGEGGGVLLNQCPHNLDVYYWLFGMPQQVRAFCGFGRFHDIEVEDAVTAYMEHANGANSVFIATTGEAPGTDRLEIAGDRGRVVFEHGKIVFDETLESVQKFSDETPSLFPHLETWRCEAPAGGPGGTHMAILKNFVGAILRGEALIAPGEEGIYSLELANAMIYSAWTGATVELPLDSDAYETALKGRIANSRHRKAVQERAAEDMAASYH